MKIKKLLVRFEFDPDRTRWLSDRGRLALFVESLMKSVATCHTTGQIPAITVTEEEQPETATAHANQH
jgi:hypothetical protein